MLACERVRTGCSVSEDASLLVVSDNILQSSVDNTMYTLAR
jgi:hypothetical protein